MSRRADGFTGESIAQQRSAHILRPGNIVVPGHDVPMVLENGQTKYIDKREAAIVAWYGDDMETTTLFKLTV
jgi:hypothetical protein